MFDCATTNDHDTFHVMMLNLIQFESFYVRHSSRKGVMKCMPIFSDKRVYNHLNLHNAEIPTCPVL